MSEKGPLKWEPSYLLQELVVGVFVGIFGTPHEQHMLYTWTHMQFEGSQISESKHSNGKRCGNEADHEILSLGSV